MKLYSEEQVRSMLNRAKIFDGEVKDGFVFILSEQDILASETQIELPSKEQIEKTAESIYPIKDDVYMDLWSENKSWKEGAEWVIVNIENQTK